VANPNRSVTPAFRGHPATEIFGKLVAQASTARSAVIPPQRKTVRRQ
jgi:hypothetical protein